MSSICDAWKKVEEKMPESLQKTFDAIGTGLSAIVAKIKELKDKAVEKVKEKLAEDKEEATATNDENNKESSEKNKNTKDDEQKREQNGRTEGADGASESAPSESQSNTDRNAALMSIEGLSVDQVTCLSLIDKDEQNMLMYFSERDALGSLDLTQPMNEETQKVYDSYLKKSDGSYFNSLEEKFGIDPGAITEDDTFEDVVWEYAELRRAVKLGYENLSDASMDDISERVNYVDQNKAALYDQMALTVEMDHAESAIDKVCVADNIDEYERISRMYLDEKRDFNNMMTAMDHAPSSDVDKPRKELIDKYLKKEDGTYYANLEEKFGIDPNSSLASATKIEDVPELKNLRSSLESQFFDAKDGMYLSLDKQVIASAQNIREMEDHDTAMKHYQTACKEFDKDHGVEDAPSFDPEEIAAQYARGEVTTNVAYTDSYQTEVSEQKQA